MRYLITTTNEPPFYSRVFDPENHFMPDLGMVVYDMQKHVYTTDGVTWHQIEFDSL